MVLRLDTLVSICQRIWIFTCYIIVILSEILFHYKLEPDLSCLFDKNIKNNQVFINQFGLFKVLSSYFLTNCLFQIEEILETEGTCIFRECVLR